MLCRQCGATNPEERQFCHRCRASLHWHAVVGPDRSSGRQGVIGLLGGAIVFVVGLLIFSLPAGGAPVPADGTPAGPPTETPAAVSATPTLSPGSTEVPAVGAVTVATPAARQSPGATALPSGAPARPSAPGRRN